MRLASKLFVIAVLGLLLFWIIIDRYSLHKLHQATSNWPVINRNLDQLATVIPVQGETDSFNNVRAHYKKFLNDIKFLDESNSLLSKAPISKRNHSRAALGYLNQHLFDPTDNLAAPPSEVIFALEKLQSSLVLLKRDLEERLIDFPQNVELSPIEPVANYISLRELNRYLLVKALVSHYYGAPRVAWSYVYASARITDSLLAHQDIMTQMTAVATGSETLIVMRKMPVPIPRWAENWPSIDPKPILMGYAIWARSLLTMVNEANTLQAIDQVNEYRDFMNMEPIKADPATRVMLFAFEDQYLRLICSHFISGWKKVISRYIDQELCWSFADNANAHWPEHRMPNWIKNSLPVRLIFFADDWSPGSQRYWDKFKNLQIHKEGTLSILRAKQLKSDSLTDTWPPTISKDFQSCPDLEWNYQANWDGTATFVYQPRNSSSETNSSEGDGTYRFTGGNTR